MTKKIISVFLSLLMIFAMIPMTGMTSFALTSGDFQYNIHSETDKTCGITKYNGSASKLEIPSEIDGYTVVAVGTESFRDCTSLISVTIPGSVKTISAFAFYGCTSLANIVISDGVTEINHQAFEGCSSLTNVTIPNSIMFIRDSAFKDCVSLKNITIPGNIWGLGWGVFEGCISLENIILNGDGWIYCSVDGVLFDSDKTMLICYPAGKSDTDYVIPESVTSIEDLAFSDCASLKNVTIPDSVTKIGNWAFAACTALSSAVIPNSVTEMGNSAFLGCTSLSDITIPDSLTLIDSETFKGCTSLSSVTIPDSVTSIEYSAFEGCTSLTSVTVPNSVTKIDTSAFADCTSFENITIPDSVTSISCDAYKNTAYYNDENNWENGVLYIDDCLMEAKKDISGEYIIKSGTRVIADGAFYDCDSLTDVIIPDGVVIIGWSAFQNCNFLMKVTIPESVTQIGYDAFKGCLVILTIYGYKDTEAQRYANENGIRFVALCKHTELTEVPFKAPTCTEDGNVEYYSCAECGKNFSDSNGTTELDSVIIPAKGHSLGDWVITKEPTETEDGEKTRKCLNCEYEETETIPMLKPAISDGDVNGDGKVSAMDARWILQFTAGTKTLTAEQIAAADMNGDGKVSAVDARAILKITAGN